MGKRILYAVLWGLSGWMWAAIAHVFLGTPELSAITGAAALVIAFVLLAPRPRINASQRATTGTQQPGLDTARSHR